MSDQFYTLITGASEGLGRALAIESARRKLNLILVALPDSGLQNLAAYIKINFSVEVTTIEKDLCQENSCQEIFNEVMDLGLRINMLFNNAGSGSTGTFAEGNIHLFERQVKLNVLATTLITHLFTDMLKRNSPSYILNVGSLASYFPLPKKQVYGATKSYINYFSQCLSDELKRDRVYVSVLCPGPMYTNISVRSVIENGNWFIRNCSFYPEEVAPIAMAGLFRKKKIMVPGRLNKCYILLYSLLPDFIKTFITNRSMKKLNSAVCPQIVLYNSLAMNTAKKESRNYN